VVGVPVILPVPVLIESPGGRPVADHEEMEAADEESVAELDNGLMADPERFDWGPGFATDTVLVTTQVKPAELVNPESSVAVTVTDEDPAVVGVPLITPVLGSMDSPSGSPVAE
jgi:hypothetical protein